MLVPVKWLKDYININIDANTLADKMTMSGSKVEEVKNIGEDIKGVVVGRLESIKPHPDADKLVIVIANVGTEKLQIVTGAKNVKEGDYVPVAIHGAELAGGLKIKKGKLRGEVSEGMLCSQEEVGIAKSMIPEELKDGIWILDKEYSLGADLKEVVPFADDVIEFEITSNRPDCLSMIGIARETSATLGLPFEYPTIKLNEQNEKSEDIAKVSIEDKEGCSRYIGRVITDVKIEASPLWMQQRLVKAGVRPINNIVDITNYVMLEYGQPLHAFDLDHIEDNTIIVRKALENEEFKTLDGVQRTLTENMTVIADTKKALAIAGVMGGLESEVTKETKTILLESAHFNADKIRATSKKLGLRTEASARFEKGVDPNIADVAANRACQLIEELGAGKVLRGSVDVYHDVRMPLTRTIRVKRINDLLGTNLSAQDMIKILESLEIKAVSKDELLEVVIPTFRMDLDHEADFAEEIGRIFGYDNLPATMAKGNIAVGGKTDGQLIEDLAKKTLNSIGMNELLTYSFVSPRSVNKINIAENDIKRNFVKLLNPLGDETSAMRTTILTNLLDVLERNNNRKVESARAFELGRIFIPKADKSEKLPDELKSLVIGMYGNEDFFTLKGAINSLLDTLGIKDYDYEVEKNNPTYHPGRCANIMVGDRVLGTLGELHPMVSEEYGFSKRCYCAEIDFEMIIELTKLDVLYKPLPKYPSIIRDFAFVLKEEIYVKEIENIIRRLGGDILESFKLFDVYKGDQVEEGHKSVAYTLTYRHKERTLTDDDVNKINDKILSAIKEELGGVLR